ncbi:MAG TPA: hypothetical protein DIV79_09495 [Opitutae bacterium]|nr:hypothetical protein [Opitutae bacterium]
MDPLQNHCVLNGLKNTLSIDLLTICWNRCISLHLSVSPWKPTRQQDADKQHPNGPVFPLV